MEKSRDYQEKKKNKTAPRLHLQQSLQRKMGGKFKTQVRIGFPITKTTENHKKNTKNVKALKRGPKLTPLLRLREKTHTRRCVKPSPNVAPRTPRRHKNYLFTGTEVEVSRHLWRDSAQRFLSTANIFDMTPEARITALAQISAGRKMNSEGWNNRLGEKKNKRTMRKICYLCSPGLESALRGTSCIYSKINTMIYSETQF